MYMMLNEDERVFHEYFRVAFYGAAFPPAIRVHRSCFHTNLPDVARRRTRNLFIEALTLSELQSLSAACKLGTPRPRCSSSRSDPRLHTTPLTRCVCIYDFAFLNANFDAWKLIDCQIFKYSMCVPPPWTKRRATPAYGMRYRKRPDVDRNLDRRY